MKKVIFILSIFLLTITPLYASCSYEDELNLAKVASHITSSYTFNDKTKTFTVKLFNVTDDFLVKYDSLTYYPQNNEITFDSVEQGTYLSIKIYGNYKSGCFDKYLRTHYLTLPYLNDYYNSINCNNYKEYEICSNRFLPYKMTGDIFKNYTKQIDEQRKVSKEIESTSMKQDVSHALEFVQNNWIKILLITLSATISLVVSISIIKKAKYGF